MAFLLNEFPAEQIVFQERLFDVDMAFDNILDVLDILEDDELTTMKKIYDGLYLLIGDDVDTLTLKEQSVLLDRIFKELVQMEVHEKVVELDRQGNPLPVEDSQSSKNLYDLKFDASYIWTAFMQVYRMDLHEQIGRLHWIKFMLLMRDLPDDVMFSKIQDIRGKKLSDIKDLKERRNMKKLQKAFKLPSVELEDDEFGDRFRD